MQKSRISTSDPHKSEDINLQDSRCAERFHGFIIKKKKKNRKKNPAAARNSSVEYRKCSPCQSSLLLLIRKDARKSWRIGHLRWPNTRFKFAQRAIYFSVKCIPHPRVFVKVLHGIAVKRCRGPKDTASIRHRGGCKKKQRPRTGFRVLLDRARCPIANSSHLFGPPALPRRPSWPESYQTDIPESPMLIPITWNSFRERNFKTAGQSHRRFGDFIATASIIVSPQQRVP